MRDLRITRRCSRSWSGNCERAHGDDEGATRVIFPPFLEARSWMTAVTKGSPRRELSGFDADLFGRGVYLEAFEDRGSNDLGGFTLSGSSPGKAGRAFGCVSRRGRRYRCGCAPYIRSRPHKRRAKFRAQPWKSRTRPRRPAAPSDRRCRSFRCRPCRRAWLSRSMRRSSPGWRGGSSSRTRYPSGRYRGPG